MKMSDMRAKARAIFGPAFAEPMPNQPNGAKALQQRANARPIPTYKVGGPVKKPMPTPADLAAAKAQNEMIKKATVSKKEAAAIAAMQPAQARRKKQILSRLAALMVTGRPWPRYRGLRLWAAAARDNPVAQARSFAGLVRRLVQGRA